MANDKDNNLIWIFKDLKESYDKHGKILSDAVLLGDVYEEHDFNGDYDWLSRELVANYNLDEPWPEPRELTFEE
ncbi:hypothetical protein ACQUW5_13090 [Legionella sp. CNM-1927-20]|uniref:hypothetical protein n=1 Tax=Legionella sp. CNM-1927-20 TaxID=3422221 RepID=UPI00403ADEC9